jgi:hypothetical protein
MGSLPWRMLQYLMSAGTWLSGEYFGSMWLELCDVVGGQSGFNRQVPLLTVASEQWYFHNPH